MPEGAITMKQRPSTSAVLLAGVLTLSFLFCYNKVFYTLIRAWMNNSVYSHGFLVPFVSLFLILQKRPLFASITPSPAVLAGSAALVSGLLVLLAGHAGGVIVVQELSIIIVLSGIVLLVLGPGFLKALAFPIAYLAFMLRFWDSLTMKLHYPLQKLSAVIGAGLLKAIGIPYYRSDIFIELPTITLEVADVCSGVNYLIAVTAVGVVLAYLFMRSWRKRFLLITAALLIAMLSNGLRVGLIGTLVYYGISGDLHGPYHVLQAMFTSAIGFLALFAGAWILADRQGGAPVPKGAEKILPGRGPATKGIKTSGPAIAAVALLIGAGAFINFSRPEPVSLEMSLSIFPRMISGWKGIDVTPSLDALRKTGFDEQVSRLYRNENGDEAVLFIGYFRHQEHDRELVNYMISRLHDGAVTITVHDGTGGLMEANRAEPRGWGETVFWYSINNRETTDRIKAKAYSVWDRVTKRRTNGAFVAVMASSADGKIPPGFLNAAMPDIRSFTRQAR